MHFLAVVKAILAEVQPHAMDLDTALHCTE
jgi:hypothetical protein